MNNNKRNIINYVLISLLSLILFIPCFGYKNIKADEEVETNDVDQVVEVEETQEEVALEEEALQQEEEQEVETIEVEETEEENVEPFVVESEIDENILDASRKIQPGKSLANATLIQAFDYNVEVDDYYFTTDSDNTYYFKFIVTEADAKEPGTYFQFWLTNYSMSGLYAKSMEIMLQTEQVISRCSTKEVGQSGKVNTKLNAGTYYLRISESYRDSEGNLGIKIIKFKDDAGNVVDKAKNLEISKSYKLNLSCGLDVDYFKFTALTSSSVVNITNVDSGGIEIYIYDEKMVQIKSATIWKGYTIDNFIDTVKGKVYYILVKYRGNADDFSNYQLQIKIPISKLTLNKTSITLDPNKTFTLKPTISPSNATNKVLNWSSSNTNIATVDSKGKIKAIKPGTVTISATTTDGTNLKATCTVVVRDMRPCKLNTRYAWEYKDNKQYWYENGVKQGVYKQKGNVWYNGTERGREIYDPCSDGWYWLDALYSGAKAVNKEVFMPYIYQDEDNISNSDKRNRSYASDNVYGAPNKALMADQVYNAMIYKTGKWVRYDSEGKMIKGWYTVSSYQDRQLYPDQAGNTYYYDYQTGLMAKGRTVIDGKTYYFDETTGALRK